MKHNLLIDISNVYWRCAHVAHMEGDKQYMTQIEIHSYWKHMCIQSILAVVNKEEWDKVIMCYDSRGYWRNKIYPAYKANRKTEKAKGRIDFETFILEINQLTIDLKDKFQSVYHLEVKEAEADDIAGVITKDLVSNGECVTIMTGDKDYKQLLKYPNVVIYDPRTKKNMTSLNIAKEMEVKYIMGDRGDNIFAIKPKTGEVRAKAMVESGKMHEMHVQYHENKQKLTEEEVDMVERYELNRQLISWEYIPMNIQNDIRKQFNEYQLTKFDQGKMLIWLNDNDLTILGQKFLKNQSLIFMNLYDNFKNKKLNSEFF